MSSSTLSRGLVRAGFVGAKLRLRLGGEIYSTILHLWPTLTPKNDGMLGQLSRKQGWHVDEIYRQSYIYQRLSGPDVNAIK